MKQWRKQKEAIIKTSNKNEYKDMLALMDIDEIFQLHQPLHAAVHLLNPYVNLKLNYDLEVINGYLVVPHRLGI